MSTNGIDFVIGGKDKAKPAMSSVEQSLARLEKKTEDVGRATRTLTGITAGLAAGYAAIKTAIAAIGGLDKINAAYATQTAAVKSLNAAMKVRGDTIGVQSDQLQSYAAELQKLTGVGDEVTIGLMQQAAAMGFATDRIDDAAKAAIGLADVTGKSLEQSLGDLKSALEGNFTAFEGLNPQIRFMRSNQEKLAAVMAIVEQGLVAQSQNMNTVEGSGKRASGAFGDLLESLGAIIAPIRVLLNTGIKTLSESLITLLAPAVQWATELLENIGPVMDYVKDKVIQGVNLIVGAFTFFEVIVTNLGDVWEMVTSQIELFILQIIGSVMQAFTVTIPAYIGWFAENFINIIKDAFNAVITIITNAGRKIGEIVYQIFAFIASGGEGGIAGLMRDIGTHAGGSLLEGFESSLTSLPEIATRQLTQREKDLAEKIGAIGGRLGDEFASKIKGRMLGVGDSLTAELTDAQKKANLQVRANVITQGVNVTEGRVLTRGPGTYLPNKLDDIIRLLKDPPPLKSPRSPILVQNIQEQAEVFSAIAKNTGNTLQLEPVA